MSRNLIALFLFVLISTQNLLAHQDTVLQVEGEEIKGLPKKYSPAFFDYEKTTLKIAGKTLVLPESLQGLFLQPAYSATFDPSDPTADPFDSKFDPKLKKAKFNYVFSASWYHDDFEDALPPYMLIRVESAECDYAFEILVNMDDLTILRADVSMSKIGRIPIDLDGVVDAPKPK